MNEVNNCRRCDLWRNRRKPVLGDGNIDTTMVFIGEAPGYWEDIKGKPFVGSAGKLLDEILKDNLISRSNVYITNIVKCRPPENRDPRPEEIEACKVYLERQLDLIRPRIIVTLGRHSTAYIFLKANVPFKSISESQGKVYEVKFWEAKTYVIPSYHPAAALYNAKLRDEIRNAIKLAKELESKLNLKE
ncbi:MAG: type-4 uracil-DNA glycosylase [Candidatus Bathyarchaeia archaeon]